MLCVLAIIFIGVIVIMIGAINLHIPIFSLNKKEKENIKNPTFVVSHRWDNFNYFVCLL